GYFCDVARRRMGVGPVRLDASAVDTLLGYPWPGNVRELENVISRAVLRRTAVVPRGEAIVLSAKHLESDVGNEAGKAAPPAVASLHPAERAPKRTLKESSRALQRDIVERALADHPNNLAAAARALGMDRGNFHRLVRRLGLAKGR
ncbi:MAG TPA: sigma-54-dependent Fis family transcriptional regulator, partial [Polyangia bacterium]